MSVDLMGPFLNALHTSLVWLSGFIYILIVGAILVFIFRFRRSSDTETKYVSGNRFFGWIFVAIPMILLLFIFGWGYSIYRHKLQTPADAYEIHIIAKQCHWLSQYGPKTKKAPHITTDTVFVPLGKPVKLVLTSEDMNYSLLVPDLQINQEVIPGLNTSLWFETHIAGQHKIFSSEPCGSDHVRMQALLIVLEDEQWKNWNAENAKLSK